MVLLGNACPVKLPILVDIASYLGSYHHSSHRSGPGVHRPNHKAVRSPRKVALVLCGTALAKSNMRGKQICDGKKIELCPDRGGAGSVAFIPVYWPTSEGLCPPDWSRSPAQREFQIWHTEEPMFIGFHCLGETGSKMRPPPFQTLIKGESLDIGNWNTQNIWPTDHIFLSDWSAKKYPIWDDIPKKMFSFGHCPNLNI